MKRFINFALIAFIPFLLFAAYDDFSETLINFEFQFKPYDLGIIIINQGQISLDYQIDQETAMPEFHRISLPGVTTTTQEVGRPELPVFVRTIVARVRPVITVTETEMEILKDLSVYPFQAPEIEENGPVKFVFNQAFYQQNIEWPNPQLFEISEAMVWRGLRIYQLKIYPMIYNPAKKEIKFYKKIKLNIQYTPYPAKLEVSAQEYRFLKGVVTNLDKVPLEVKNQPQKYLIVYDKLHDYDRAIKSLIDWYEKKGIEIKTHFFVNQIIPETLKAWIKYDYSQRKTDWVLLVGNYQQIPAYLYKSGYDQIYSDTWYGQVDGDDFYADIAVGRLPVDNKEELEKMIQKILDYEKSPPSDDWLVNTLLVAHEEEYPEKYTQCIREIAETSYPLFPVKFQLVLGGEKYTNQDITQAINQGRGIVNYRGHGDWDIWAYWNGRESWETRDVSQLINQAKTPVVFNIACNNHQVDRFSLGQAWLKKYPGGAVASLGATAPSYTLANHTYNKFLWLGLGQQGIYEIGWLNNFASAKILEQHGIAGEDNTMMYCWYGDPAMEIRTDIPKNFGIKTERKGDQLKVKVGDKEGQPLTNALVCLYRKGNLIRKPKISSTGYTDQNGEVIMRMPKGRYTLTVTLHNYLPNQQKIKRGLSIFGLFWL